MKIIKFVFIAFLLAACSPQVGATTPTATQAQLMSTATPTNTSTPIPTLSPTLSPTPKPQSSISAEVRNTSIQNFLLTDGGKLAKEEYPDLVPLASIQKYALDRINELNDVGPRVSRISYNDSDVIFLALAGIVIDSISVSTQPGVAETILMILNSNLPPIPLLFSVDGGGSNSQVIQIKDIKSNVLNMNAEDLVGQLVKVFIVIEGYETKPFWEHQGLVDAYNNYIVDRLDRDSYVRRIENHEDLINQYKSYDEFLAAVLSEEIEPGIIFDPEIDTAFLGHLLFVINP